MVAPVYTASSSHFGRFSRLPAGTGLKTFITVIGLLTFQPCPAASGIPGILGGKLQASHPGGRSTGTRPEI